jgi:hypothetical protein
MRPRKMGRMLSSNSVGESITSLEEGAAKRALQNRMEKVTSKRGEKEA